MHACDKPAQFPCAQEFTAESQPKRVYSSGHLLDIIELFMRILDPSTVDPDLARNLIKLDLA